MTDCELEFKSDGHNVSRCLEKSWLYGNNSVKTFRSLNKDNIKEYIQNIIKDSLDIERNLNNTEETLIWYGILFHITHLEAIKSTSDIYCEIMIR